MEASYLPTYLNIRTVWKYAKRARLKRKRKGFFSPAPVSTKLRWLNFIQRRSVIAHMKRGNLVWVRASRFEKERRFKILFRVRGRTRKFGSSLAVIKLWSGSGRKKRLGNVTVSSTRHVSTNRKQIATPVRPYSLDKVKIPWGRSSRHR